jgi:peptide/nickel transport system substrate-binding protein
LLVLASLARIVAATTNRGNRTMKRRRFIQGAAVVSALAGPAIRAETARAKTLKLVPLTSLYSLDTVFNTSLVTTNHGWAVYDTLFGLNARREIKPQMAEGYTLSDDGLVYVIKLREGLKFHNGEPVRAQDCIQSLKRWAGRETFGQTIAQFIDTWNAQDDRTLKVTFSRPVPIFLEAIARGSASVPFILPEHIAATDPYKQITDPTGCGPWKFNMGEFAAGSFASYSKFADYIPRPEPAEYTAGGKVVHFDRMEWPTIPESATAAAALISGEVDWYEQAQADLVPQLRKHPDIRIGSANPGGFNGILRFNHLQPPFNNVAVRRAILMMANQPDYMASITGGDATAFNACRSMFPCGTPYGRELGADAMRSDMDKARAMLKSSGYNGEKVVIISPSDVPTIGPMGDVTYDLLKKLGMNAELVSTDWATLTNRRASREPVEKGGWSIFHTWAPSGIIGTPVEHFAMRGLGAKGWAGWFEDGKIEELTRDWTLAKAPEARVTLADQIQARALEMVPFVLCGQFQIRTAYRSYLSGVIEGSAAYMWNVRRA